MLVTKEVLSNGTDTREVHPENIDAMLVHDPVSNSGTVFSDLQKENIPFIAVAFTVLKCGTERRLLHPENVLAKLFTLIVLKGGICFNFKQATNILCMFVFDLVS